MTTPTIGQKAVTKKTSESHPPRDIRENTKARRAWLASELERVNALPNTSGRIVGNGSYQCVAIYTTTYKAGRVRHRGVCQYCGCEQVVDAGRLVHHGYSRPGWGYIVNVCPGAGRAPLNTEKTETERWLAAEIARLPWMIADEQAAHVAYMDAKAAAAVEGYDFTARYTKPQSLWSRDAKNPAMVERYEAQLAAWRVEFPLWSRAFALADVEVEARSARVSCEQRRDHFAALLASPVYGSPLTEEVVA